MKKGTKLLITLLSLPVVCVLAGMYFVKNDRIFVSDAVRENREYCKATSQLKKFNGHYIKPEIWNRFSIERNWNLIWSSINTEFAAFGIRDGEPYAITKMFHEGIGACFKIKENQFWFRSSLNSLDEGKWMGPFLRVGAADDEGRIYFDQIFQKKCFTSDPDKERWCFDSGAININGKIHKASLMFDPFFSPRADHIGSEVRVDDEMENFYWIFLPDGDGWKVFREELRDDVDHDTKLEPSALKVWRSLIPER